MTTRAEAGADVRSVIERLVAEGFLELEEIQEQAMELVNAEYPEHDLGAIIEGATRFAMKRHLDSERAWPESTDCDRLELAFAELNASGIVARHNFACCQNCGHAEMKDEVAQAQELGTVRGYVFYHMQDTSRAAEGGGLYLAYDCVSRGEKKQAEIGHEVVAELRRAGLEVQWDGDAGKRILVPMHWQRRRLRGSN